MSTNTHLAAAVAAGLLLVTPTPAQGPIADLLPADSAFVAHFELGRMASVFDVRGLLAELGGEDAAQFGAILDRLDDTWGFDPCRDLVSLTVFDVELPEDTPGLLLVVDGGASRALEALGDLGALQSERSRGLTFHRLHAGGVAAALGFDDVDADDGDSAMLYIHELGGNRRAILIGERTGDILGAARVLAGEADSLQDARRPALELKSSRSCLAYIEIATSLEDLTRRTPASELARRVHSLVGELSEQQGTLGVELTAVTDSRSDAENVAAVVNGLRGLLALADLRDEVPEAVRETVMNARAEADGSRVTVKLSASLDQLRQLMADEVLGRHRASRRSRHHRDDGEADEDRASRGKKRYLR